MVSKGAEILNCSQVPKMQFIFTMLPDTTAIRSVIQKLTKSNMNKHTIVIDSSTTDPVTAKCIKKIISSNGAHFVEAPASGGVSGAEQATLTFMVGSSVNEYKIITPVLKCMGQKIIHCGECGMGQAAKLCNNMLLAISIIGVSEAMNLAIRLGLDSHIFANILNESTGKCWSSEIYNPVPGISKSAPANNNYDGGCSIDIFLKDLRFISSVARSSNTPIQMGELAHQIFQILKVKGLGSKDFSIIYDFLKG